MEESRIDISNFVQILIDALAKKERLLDEILKLCKVQEECIRKESPNMVEYSQCSDKKMEISKHIEKIDEGFLSVYDRVKNEIEGNPSQYTEEIRKMKSLVTAISEKTASVSVNEQRLNVEFKKKVGSGAATQSFSKSAVSKYAQTMKVQTTKESEATFINEKQ